MILHPVIAWVLLAACSGGSVPAGGGRDFREFIGSAGELIELRPPMGTDTGPVMDTGGVAIVSRWLAIEDAAWGLRSGDDWDTGAVLGEWALAYEGGLIVAGAQLLPERIAEGESAGGARIRTLTPYETGYGTFLDAVTVEVAEGEWAGTQVFAAGAGPVSLTLGGEVWELVWYQRGE